MPKIIAELGPGDSLGIGLAALISGCEKYYAFDIIKHTNAKRNIHIFDELVSLFARRENIPGKDEFPNIKPDIEDHRFPEELLAGNNLSVSMRDNRIKKIRDSIFSNGHPDSMIHYKAPWTSSDLIEKETIDMIYSQAVLEHIDDLSGAYKSMRMWLKPNGYISHMVDFKCHGTAEDWNGHWAYSDFTWKIIRGRRPYHINREPLSIHIEMLEEQSFKIVCQQAFKLPSRLKREDMGQKFRKYTDDDISTSGLFIQAVKI